MNLHQITGTTERKLEMTKTFDFSKFAQDVDARDKKVLDDLHEQMKAAKQRGDQKEFERLGDLYTYYLRKSG